MRAASVQQIVLPDRRSVALEIYAHQQRLYLLLSAHPQASRVHLLEHKPRRGVPKETPLLLLLRKYVRSARLESVELPVPFERVLFLRFHHAQHDATTLAVEPIGQLGNLILMNADGRILDALVRVPAGENAQRRPAAATHLSTAAAAGQMPANRGERRHSCCCRPRSG